MRARLWTAALAIGLSLASASATAAFITSRAALGGDDLIDWSQLGPVPSIAPEPATVVSNLGLSAQVTAPHGILVRVNQGFGWYGNFAPGDALIFTGDEQFQGQRYGPIVIDFATPVRGAGAQINMAIINVFTGAVSVYSTSNTLLESYSLGGYTGGSADNSAIFLGVLRPTADIDRIEFDVLTLTSSRNRIGLAINQLSLLSAPNGVPEPSTLALLGVGLAGLAAARRRKQ